MELITLSTDLETKKESPLFLVEFDEKNIDDLLHFIKGSKDVSIYAKPLFLVSDDEIDPYYEQCVDGVITQKDVEQKSYLDHPLVNKINKFIKTFQKIPDEEDIVLKVLRYLYVRDIKLKPFANIKRYYGYSYPKIDHFLSPNDDLYEVLSFLTERKLLETDFYDTAHFCPNCDSGFLNFQEVCIYCHSSNLDKEFLIHHFECAYVGAMREFEQGDRLICPKCNKELFHIGVDYDRPSIIYHCNNCSKEFQDPLVQTKCYACHSVFDVDNIKQRKIYTYSLSTLAQYAAIFGLSNIFKNIMHERIEILPSNMFQHYLETEYHRIKRYKKSVSTLLLLNLYDIEKIYNNINDILTLKNILGQLSDIIKNFLRKSDIITMIHDASYGILLLDTSLENAKIASQRLKKDIEALVKENTDIDIDVSYELYQIDPEQSLEDLKKAIHNG